MFDPLCGHKRATGKGPCTASILATMGPGKAKPSYIYAVPQPGYAQEVDNFFSLVKPFSACFITSPVHWGDDKTCSVNPKQLCALAKPRTSEEMDRTLHTDFAKSRTTWDILTKISTLLKLWKIWFLTKFKGCSSKIETAMPMGSFLRFLREIQILSTYDLDFLCKAGFYRGQQLVKIWCWYLNPLLRNSKLTVLSFQFASN